MSAAQNNADLVGFVEFVILQNRIQWDHTWDEYDDDRTASEIVPVRDFDDPHFPDNIYISWLSQEYWSISREVHSLCN